MTLQNWKLLGKGIRKSRKCIIYVYNKLKEVGETTRPLRYDRKQLSYGCTVEVTNRFRGLYMIAECLKNYGQRFLTLYTRGWSKPSPRNRNAKRQNVVWGGLTNSWEKKRNKRQRRKGKIYTSECRVPSIARRDKKALLNDQCKEIEENNRMGKTRDFFKKIRDTKGMFYTNMGTITDGKG